MATIPTDVKQRINDIYNQQCNTQLGELRAEQQRETTAINTQKKETCQQYYDKRNQADVVNFQNGVSLDLVGAVKEGYEKGEGGTGSNITNAGASLLGEVVGNIPGGNLLTNQVNTDKKVPFTDLQYKELFGERDPNRFGTGLTVAKTVQDPLFEILPYGASQVRKTTQGVDAI
ncbi:hypothetical protein [Bacillus sp. JJ1562]|uniref:hypothetical protein n=1 Tax=Bacillus sp. JJ1562 TaxID=3122960 RepID=UPI00300309FB